MLIRGLKVPLLCEFCFSFCVASWESYKEVRTCCNTIVASNIKASTYQEAHAVQTSNTFIVA